MDFKPVYKSRVVFQSGMFTQAKYKCHKGPAEIEKDTASRHS